jgi:AcrR family transcriptional regulator
MSPKPAAVKVGRKYDASRRKAEARSNHERIVAVAERHFLRDGYAPTTVHALAEAADVSVDTIYKTFGGKPGLVRAIRDRALLGEGPVPAEHRSDRLHVDQLDGKGIIRAWGTLTTEVAPRVAPILLLLRDAGLHDPELRSLLAEMDAQRMERMTINARRLKIAGHLRAGMTIPRAAEILWTYSSPELYELLVIRQRWNLKRYGSFIADAMIDALL